MAVLIDHRPAHRYRARPIFGALRLRRPAAQHTRSESELLRTHAVGATTLVELGVAEGGSAMELRHVMAPGGTLHLVDPYSPGSLGVSLELIVARRAVSSVDNGQVRWWRGLSSDIAARWSDRIDFLFIDADHSFEGVSRDWEDWAPRVRPGGHVALHDARVFPGGWTHESTGPVRLVARLENDPRWRIAGTADSMVVLQRVVDEDPIHLASSAAR
jgi:predicted O-methyltransferase YrrM